MLKVTQPDLVESDGNSGSLGMDEGPVMWGRSSQGEVWGLWWERLGG